MMMPSSDEDDEDERMDEAELGYDALDLDDLDDNLIPPTQPNPYSVMHTPA